MRSVRPFIRCAATLASGSRVPSINFRFGKRVVSAGPSTKIAATALPPQAAGSFEAQQAKLFPSKATKTYMTLPPMFGRPLMSDQEMRAIMSGGAY